MLKFALEMNWRKHIWITALQKHISLEHAKQLVLEIHKLRYADEREWADAVLQLAIANNKEIFEKMKEEEFMCQALRELMAPEIDEELTKAERKGKNAGITILFETMQRLKNGETVENLRKSGWDEKTLDVALAALRL